MITETLERPLTSHQLTEAEAWEARRKEAHSAAFVAAINGVGEFWDDEHASVYAAVRAACANDKLFHEQRWLMVFAAVCREAQQYAVAVAEETL